MKSSECNDTHRQGRYLGTLDCRATCCRNNSCEYLGNCWQHGFYGARGKIWPTGAHRGFPVRRPRYDLRVVRVGNSQMAPMGTCAGAWYFHTRVVRRRLGFVGGGLGSVISPCSMLGLELVGAPVGPLSLLAKSSNELTRPIFADDSSFMSHRPPIPGESRNR